MHSETKTILNNTINQIMKPRITKRMKEADVTHSIQSCVTCVPNLESDSTLRLLSDAHDPPSSSFSPYQHLFQ